VVRRGRLRIAANLGSSEQFLPLGARGTAVLTASVPGVKLDGEAVMMAAGSFAVVEV
jgi:hypothetical protein